MNIKYISRSLQQWLYEMKICVIAFGKSCKYCEYHRRLLPTFILEGNAKFYLEVSENKVLGFPSPKSHKFVYKTPKVNAWYRPIVCKSPLVSVFPISI